MGADDRATSNNQESQEPSIKRTVRLNLERSQSSQACTVLLLFLADLLVVLEPMLLGHQ